MNKQKYKKVKLGPKEVEIPEEWEVKKVKELGEVITGTTPSKKNSEYWNGEIKFVTPTDIGKGRFIKKSMASLSSKGLTKAKKIPKNAIMITCIASLGKNAISREEVATNQQINTIVCNKKNQFLFFYYMLNFRTNYLKSISGQTAVPIVNKSEFSKIPILRPPLPEQKKIASILSNVDEAIQKTDEIIEKTKNLKKGLMQNLLTKGIEHAKFKTVKLGPKEVEIPEEWELKELDICMELLTDFEANGSFSDLKENVNVKEGQGYAWYLRTTDLENKNYPPSKEIKYVDESSYYFLKKTKVSGGELVMTKRGYVGKVFLIPNIKGNATIAPNLYLLKLKSNISNKYAYYYLDSKLGQDLLNSRNDSSTMGAIYKDDLKQLPLVYSPLPEQKKIASILSNVDKKIKKEKKYKDKLQKLKKGLMQDLLTGKVRVKVNKEVKG